MQPEQPSRIDPKLVEEDKWFSILLNPDFSIVREYISKRIETYRIQREELDRNVSQDNMLKSSHIASRIEEMKLILRVFEQKLVEIARDKERRNKPGQLLNSL